MAVRPGCGEEVVRVARRTGVVRKVQTTRSIQIGGVKGGIGEGRSDDDEEKDRSTRQISKL